MIGGAIALTIATRAPIREFSIVVVICHSSFVISHSSLVEDKGQWTATFDKGQWTATFDNQAQ